MSRAVVGTTVLVVTALAVAAGSVANHIYNNFLEKKKKEDTEVKAANIIVSTHTFFHMDSLFSVFSDVYPLVVCFFPSSPNESFVQFCLTWTEPYSNQLKFGMYDGFLS